MQSYRFYIIILLFRSFFCAVLCFFLSSPQIINHFNFVFEWGNYPSVLLASVALFGVAGFFVLLACFFDVKYFSNLCGLWLFVLSVFQ
jgi:hypothetical protein